MCIKISDQKQVSAGASQTVPLIQVGSMAAAMQRCRAQVSMKFVGTSDRAPSLLYRHLRHGTWRCSGFRTRILLPCRAPSRALWA
jgi:hypothetical protein